MKSEDQVKWIEARELFLDLADLGASERRTRLAALALRDPELCVWVERLLERDPGVDDELEAEESEARDFGPYRSVRLIAVGGMGEVHLARRTDGEFEREVAIKCLRPGREGQRLAQRFLRERQFLARLDHEYIARLIDGGTTERGHPYLVLEYVEGRHIDVHCRALDLDVPERVDLFLKVLEAVQHAHDLGIVHRDLKPSNILIRPDGAPRLLDFGISRGGPDSSPDGLELTGTGQRLFTPEYASPEQIRGETATTASDVFSLGVVLYTLLAGVGPWEGSGSLHELERRVLEQEPVAPGRVARGTGKRRISVDLETIVLACLAKEPGKRLASVKALADELRRYLDGYPILTRPTRAPGRVLRFAKRNPWQSLAVVAVPLVLLLAVVSWRHSSTVNAQRELLVANLEKHLIHASDLGVQDRYDEALEEWLAARELLVDAEPTERMRILELRVSCGLTTAYLRLGEPRVALEEVDRTLARFGGDLPDHALGRVTLLIAGATACRWLSDSERAQDFAERAHALAQARLEPGTPKRIEAYQSLAGMSAAKWDLPERIRLLAKGVEEARYSGDAHDPALASILLFQGILLTENGEYEASMLSFDEALSIERWNHGEGHGEVALVRAARGDSLRLAGRLEEAREDLEAALVTLEERGHDDLIAITLQRLGQVRYAQGEFELAIEDFADSKMLYAELHGAQAPICSYLQAQVAECLVGMGLSGEARGAFEEAFEAQNGVALQGWEIESHMRLAYGKVLQELGEVDAARLQYRVSHGLRLAELGAEDERTRELAERLAALGR